MGFGAVVLALVIILFLSSVRVLNEYERGVAFTLGRFTGIKGPGLILLWPIIQRMTKVDLRVIVLDVPSKRSTAAGIGILAAFGSHRGSRSPIILPRLPNNGRLNPSARQAYAMIAYSIVRGRLYLSSST